MFESMKKFSAIIFTVKKSRIIDFLLMILLLINGVHAMNNGFSAKQGDFKYVVSIQLSGAHLCTGTIIDETHILTIVHVFIGKPLSGLSVVAGMSVVMHPFFHSIPVRKIFAHPDFRKSDTTGELDEDYWMNDVAILRLTVRLNWNSNCGPVRLRTDESNLLSCPDCVMISWQYSQDDSTNIITQTWNFVYSMSEVECFHWGIRVREDQKCFIDLLHNLVINYGDLGSPIVCNNLLIGFVDKETKNGAIAGTPSTFLMITSSQLNFISDVLKDGQRDARPGEFPYIVSIWDKNHYICGGFILDTTHILTAAHCIRISKKEDMKVASGYIEISALDSAIRWSSVHDVIRHPQYELHILEGGMDWYIKHDIAILVLVEPMIFSRTFDSLPYINTTDLSAHRHCNSLHWRYTVNDTEEVKLKVTRVGIMANETCRRLSLFLTQWQFCAGNYYYMHIADYRDIGNPIVCEGRPVGMIVRTFPMDDWSRPVAIFIWLHPYEEFIRSTLSKL